MSAAAYGDAYYVAVNSLALPLYFDDRTRWQLGWSTIYPSLIAHTAFGLSIDLISRHSAADCRQRLSHT